MIAHSPKTKLQEIFRGPFTRQRLLGKSPDTSRQYVGTLKRFEMFLERPAILADLTDETLADFMAFMLDKPKSVRYVNNARAYLVSLWRWCNARGMVQFAPTIEKLTEPEQIPTAFTVEQLKKLFDAARQETNSRYTAHRIICGVPGGLYWEALYRAIFSTGERIGAVQAWERSMLDVSTGLLVEPARIRKGKKFSHTVQLMGRALELVLQVLDCHEDELVFPWDRTDNVRWLAMKRHRQRAGLPMERYKWAFHAIRRSHASYVALEAGEVAAQDSLGHVSRVHTKRYIAPNIVVPKTYAKILPEVVVD